LTAFGDPAGRDLNYEMRLPDLNADLGILNDAAGNTGSVPQLLDQELGQKRVKLQLR
jgi:hypothetical protein